MQKIGIEGGGSEFSADPIPLSGRPSVTGTLEIVATTI